METLTVLKAVSDETRLRILTLLVRHNYCVRALARKLVLTEATISQHLKILREAGLLSGEKRGYFMHYEVNRTTLNELAMQIGALAATNREDCTPETGGCEPSERANCHVSGGEGHGCHGKRHGNRKCRKA